MNAEPFRHGERVRVDFPECGANVAALIIEIRGQEAVVHISEHHCRVPVPLSVLKRDEPRVHLASVPA